MRQFTGFFLLMLIAQLFAPKPSAAQQHGLQGRISFDEDWRFSFGHAADPSKDFNYKVANLFAKSGKAENTAIDPKFDDAGWRKLNVPHDWAPELPFVQSANADVLAHGYKPIGGLFPETSIGWYRKHFLVSKADSGQRFQIQFDGIFRDAEIWINGFYLGNHQSGYLGVQYDLTDYLNFGKENVLVVRVNATQYEGWFYEGAGIYRHVWLNQYHNLHIPKEDVFIHAAVAQEKAIITVETGLKNLGLEAGQVKLYTYLADRNGKKLAESQARDLKLAINEQAFVQQVIELDKPRLWSLEDPYLYKVVSVMKSEGQVIDSVVTRYGVRTIEIDPEKGLFLNGKHVKIKGTNNHQDHAGLGSALPDYLQYYRIGLLKEMGCNAYRTSHHAPTPELLEACDSLGMLVMDEQRLLNSSPEYMSQFEQLIKRDRNHASVFMWSIGNEEGLIQTNSIGKRIAQTLLAKQKELDPYRTSTYAADLANVFTGVNEVIPVRGFNYRQFAVADYHRDHPSQPVIGTEMGSTVTTRGIYVKDSIAGYVPDQDITAPWWASKAEDWWTLAAENPYWMGGFIWTGFDYRGEPTPYEWPNINSHFGVMDVCGFPKNIYYYYQSWWTDQDVLHISPHWNWKGREGQPVEVWVNTNAETVELFLNGKSFGKKTMPRNSHLKWSIPFQPGTLSAVAYKKGKKLTAKMETTGAAYRLVMKTSRQEITADGKDAVVVNVIAVDKQGREVPDANSLVEFSLNGDLKIIGVGNGDPSSHESDKGDNGTWKRSLFNGKCQIILQAGKDGGVTNLEAACKGLMKSTISINVKKG
jgi:beta-galactosidase